MDNRKEHTKALLGKIYELEKELNSLHTSSIEISELYNGASFLEQKKLAVSLENLFIAATHESASLIGFLRNDCVELINYIEFREKYNDFTDNELQAIIDNSISLEKKKDLLIKFETTKQALEIMNNLKSEWNKTFNNIGYLYFKEKLKI